MRFAGLQYAVVIAAVLGSLGAAAQVVHEVIAVPQPTGAYVAFKFDWDQGQPWVKYTISVDDSGNAHFEGVGSPADNGDNDSFSQDFTMSDANRQKIFELAKKTNYFQGNFEAKQKNIARTGEKTLEYHGKGDGGGQAVSHSITYNYSPNSDIQELTRLFQAIALTLDFGRKLAFQYRFDKLGMDERLKSLQDMQASHFVEELQAIEPILEKIAADPNLMNIARTTAKQLLNSAGASGGHSQTTSQP
ncbi:MAG TPA: hypothetical protein VF783_03070 [Terriglobales bacterium]